MQPHIEEKGLSASYMSPRPQGCGEREGCRLSQCSMVGSTRADDLLWLGIWSKWKRIKGATCHPKL